MIEKGRVLSLTGENIIVQGKVKTYLCKLRGALKKDKNHRKNLIIVGDIVQFAPLSDNEGVIEKIEKRSSELCRKDIVRNKKQLIAANIDQVFITSSVVIPPLKPALIDRYIIAARKGNMEPVILINKIDLFDSDEFSNLEREKKLYYDFLKVYETLGILVLSISCHTKQGIDLLIETMKDKSSVFSGQSGTGKSSLINLVTNSDLRVENVVYKTKKGSHTTTTSQLVPLSCGGFCVDTPGIKSFGLWDLQKEDIIDHFTEIKEISYDCRFDNCSHFQEPSCAVKDALEKKLISSLRFESYRSLMESLKGKDKNR